MEKWFRNKLHIVHSAYPDNPGSRGGVLIAINKGIISTKGVRSKTMIAGCALMIDVPWNSNDILWILNVYALVENAEKEGF